MRKYRKPSEIKLIELILAGSDIITGTPEYKRLLEISKSYLANTLIGALTPAADMLERYTYQLCEEVNQCGYRADWWCDWDYDYEDVVRVYEEMLKNEDY